jgi:hypothetical protein
MGEEVNAQVQEMSEVERAKQILARERQEKLRQCEQEIGAILQKYGAKLRVVHEVQIAFE